MAKVDYNRDYYADLGLRSNADANDIKKQFRKLALEYHPDRNPGREAEVNSKFQIIQSAYEVLADDEQKAKYDAHRARNTRYPTASGVKGNPWSNVGRDFPPPPQRNRPAPPNRDPTSARRYADFANAAAPPHHKTASTEDSRFRAQAFESMRPNVTRKPAPTAAASAAAGAFGSSASKPRAADSRQGAYTASQQKKAEASFGTRPARPSRSGFAPDSPMGDEPPVTNKNYFNKRHTSLFNEAHPTSHKPRDAAASGTTQAHQDEINDPFTDHRQSSPYQKRSGEKLNIFDGANIDRGKSTREVPRGRGGGGDSFVASPTQRQRSFSVPREPESPQRQTRDTGGANNRRPVATSDSPQNQTTSHSGERYTPKPSAFHHGTTASAAKDDSSSSGASAAATVGVESSYASTSKPKDQQPIFSVPSSHDDHFASKTATANPNRFMRNSADSINARFVAEEYSNTNWRFSAGGQAGNGANGAASRRSQSSTRTDRRSPTKDRRVPPPPSAAAGVAAGLAAAAAAATSGSAGVKNDPRDNVPEEAASSSHKAGFDPEGWKNEIGSQHFIPAPHVRSSVSPTRRERVVKKRAVRATKGGAAGLVDEEDSSSEEEMVPPAAAKMNGGAPSPNAMDIDPPIIQPVASTQAKDGAANGSRSVPVEPSREEWRAGNVNGFASTATPAPGSATTAGPGTNGANDSDAGPAPKSAAVKPQFNTNNATGSEDTDELRSNFSDLKNVAPFAARAAGLGSLEELASSLPFESKASGNIPGEKSKSKTKTGIDYPKPPVAPRIPAAFAVSGLPPILATWEKYVRDFEAYLLEWDSYNAKFVDHFLARQNEHQEMKAKDGLSWLHVRGDEGIQRYSQGVEVDRGVHEKWMQATAEHGNCVREFMTYRDRVKHASGT